MLNLDSLEIFSDFLQILNYIENKQQTTNDKLMQELQKQNEMYLKEILNKLERLENGNKTNI